MTSLKSNCSLFSRFHVSCQVRDRDLETFFCHENQSFPPALSQFGEIRTGTKSELLPCLEKISSVKAINWSSSTWRSGHCKYAESWSFKDIHGVQSGCLSSVREKSAPHLRRVDVVWDIYIADSLKVTTRNKREREYDGVSNPTLKFQATGRLLKGRWEEGRTISLPSWSVGFNWNRAWTSHIHKRWFCCVQWTKRWHI